MTSPAKAAEGHHRADHGLATVPATVPRVRWRPRWSGDVVPEFVRDHGGQFVFRLDQSDHAGRERDLPLPVRCGARGVGRGEPHGEGAGAVQMDGADGLCGGGDAAGGGGEHGGVPFRRAGLGGGGRGGGDAAAGGFHVGGVDRGRRGAGGAGG
jgi:hypothetical protein